MLLISIARQQYCLGPRADCFSCCSAVCVARSRDFLSHQSQQSVPRSCTTSVAMHTCHGQCVSWFCAQRLLFSLQSTVSPLWLTLLRAHLTSSAADTALAEQQHQQEREKLYISSSNPISPPIGWCSALHAPLTHAHSGHRQPSWLPSCSGVSLPETPSLPSSSRPEPSCAKQSMLCQPTS